MMTSLALGHRRGWSLPLILQVLKRFAGARTAFVQVSHWAHAARHPVDSLGSPSSLLSGIG
jgi:hypothetical protein